MPVSLVSAELEAAKRQPGAYVSLEANPGSRPGFRDLYWVKEWEPTGHGSGKLWVINCLSETVMWLGVREVARLRVEVEAPTVEIPDTPPASKAA